MKQPSDALAGAVGRTLDEDSRVQVAYLFGSRSRRTDTAQSDIDIAVLLSRLPENMLDCFLDLTDRLSETLGDGVDLVILNTASPLLRHLVIRDGKVIYSRDDKARIEFEANALREYMDLSRLRDRYDEAIKEEILKWGD